MSDVAVTPNVVGRPRIVVDGLHFPEGPRWHAGRLWFSDMRAHRVMVVQPEGDPQVVAELSDSPAGLGFLPNGDLLIVSMHERLLLRHRDGNTVVYADLAGMPGDHLNDMVVDSYGGAYVGTRTAGMDPTAPEDGSDNLIYVSPGGEPSVVARNLVAPNGAVLFDDRRLVVAETYAHRLTEFERRPDGTLTNRRVFADVGAAFPDGICADAEGGVWLGSPFTGEFLRVDSSGAVTDRLLPLTGVAIACALGGEDGNLLYLLCADGRTVERVWSVADNQWVFGLGAPTTSGSIQTVEVRAPMPGLVQRVAP